MKKPLAILLLILGGVVAMALVIFLTWFVFFMLAMLIPVGGDWVLYTLTAMFLFYASYPLLFLREFFKNKYNINAAVFTACFCVPSLIVTGILCLTYTLEIPGFISGKAVVLSWFVIPAVFTFWAIVHACIAAYKKYRDKNA